MRLVKIREQSEFQNLRSAWNTLLPQAAGNTFRTWEWASAWLSAYGSPDDLRVLTAWDDHGALRGIAPLRRQELGRFGQTAPALSFLGDGSNDSDYLDFIVARGDEDQVLRLFWQELSKELKSGTVLQLNEIPEDSPTVSCLRTFAGQENRLLRESDVPCATIHLPENWDDFLGQLKSRFRTKVRSVLRNLEGRPEVRFGFCQSADEAAGLLPRLFDLHGRRWAKDGLPGVFGWGRKRDFYARLTPLLLERGWLRFSWLTWDEHVLACQYGFVYGATYYQLQEGYEPAAEHLNLGIGLRAWSVRELQRQGVREYDFMAGTKRNKLDWGAEVKQSKQLLLAADTWKNRLICHGPDWQERAQEAVKKVVPEKILAARKSWLTRTPTSSDVPGGWVRKAAASCYFYSPLPRLLRPLRDRYQLSTGRKLAKRGQPSARILYYHRVNNDADPFFPAITTSQFEDDMRYLARHYTVVSVSELINRLRGGSTHPVLAITFDDGYQDNYLNALPILQRYGLPATIFLSTGSMDSRQPLWFESLAGAIKKTSREFVDLDCEFPRRFYLRNHQERLQSNGEIFGLLRRMDNSDRQHYLAGILGQLSAPAEDERANKMLTWDQVRSMSTRNIDFGGHTVSHPFLSRLSREELAWEVSECKRRIESEIQTPVKHFAYPNGREEDFNSWNKEVLRDAGYQAALTTIWGLNYPSTDPMEMRRGGPWEESTAQFAYKLDYYQWVND